MTCILALDQGTTSSRAIVFDREGCVRGRAQRELTQHFPAPGLVEHDPLEIWGTQLDCAREALASAGVAAVDVAAIGITNQRETTILWERATGRPLARAIVWQDRRTADECARLAGSAALIAERTGLVLDPYFSATKIAWLLDHVPGARLRAERGELAAGTVDSWLVWNLTGGRAHVTDPGNASRTMLYDIHRLAWDAELLELFRVPASLLPTVVPSSGVLAESDPGVLGASVPIAGIAGDQQAALFGQRCIAPGMVKNTYGTGCFMLLNTGSRPVRSANRLLTTIAWTIDGATEYALEGSVFVGGAIVQWLRDGLGVIRSSADVEALAASVAGTEGVVVVPALAGLGAPHWDPDARGLIGGLTRGATAAHIARAALESIAYQTHDVLEAMQADAGVALAELRVDGGASENGLLMQFQCDVLGVPVIRPRVSETTALGAAFLAGLGCGYWDDQVDVSRNWQVDRRFEPARDAGRVEELIGRWRAAVARARNWA